MSKMKEWLLDRQENGDDGTGYEGESNLVMNNITIGSLEILEQTRELDGAKLDDEGRYCVEIDPGLYAYGYRTHFGGLYVCYTCGHLCECGEEVE